MVTLKYIPLSLGLKAIIIITPESELPLRSIVLTASPIEV